MAYDKTIPADVNVVRGAGGDIGKMRSNFVDLEPAATSFALDGSLALSGSLELAGAQSIAGLIESIRHHTQTVLSGDTLVLDERAFYDYEIQDLAVRTASGTIGHVHKYTWGHEVGATLSGTRVRNLNYSFQGNQVGKPESGPQAVQTGWVTAMSFSFQVTEEGSPGLIQLFRVTDNGAGGLALQDGTVDITTSGIDEYRKTVRFDPGVHLYDIDLSHLMRVNVTNGVFSGTVIRIMADVEVTPFAGPGQVQATVAINGTPVSGMSDVTASGSQGIHTATSANSVTSGDRVTAVLGSVSGTDPANLSFSLKTVRS